MGDSAAARFAGSIPLFYTNLGLTPQALRFHPLRGLNPCCHPLRGLTNAAPLRGLTNAAARCAGYTMLIELIGRDTCWRFEATHFIDLHARIAHAFRHAFQDILREVLSRGL